MPSLYVLDNPKRRRRHNPDGTFAAMNPWYGHPRLHAKAARKGRRRRNPFALANPRRRRHNPDMIEKWFAGFDAMDIGLAALAMVAVQKVQEMLPVNFRTGFADPLSAAGVTVLGVMVTKSEPRFSKAIGMGGGIASALKVVAQFPALQNFVSPGSLVIGRHGPPSLSNMPTAALPSGSRSGVMQVSSAPAAQVKL